MGKAFASALAALALCAGSVHAQPAGPGKPVKLLAGFVAGSATDTAARILATRLGPVLGQQVIVENRPGASGALATDAVATAPADGCTLLFSSASATVNASAHDNAQTQAWKSLVPVAMVANVPNILVVHPSLGVKSVRDLVALVRSRSDGISYASSGIGTSPHMSAELFDYRAGVKMQHVPYKGSSQAMNDVLSGLVPVMFSPASSVLAPKGTDAAIVRKLAAAIEKAQDDARAPFATQNMEVLKAGPAEFAAFIDNEIARWGALIKANNILVN